MGSRLVGRERRKLRVRGNVSGTPERPRLTIFRSLSHMYAQVIDDVAGATFSQSTTSADLKTLVLHRRGLRRYVRYVGTVGTGPQVVGVSMLGVAKNI